MAKKGLNIYKRKDGRWEGRVRTMTVSGGRGYRSVYGHSYKETREKVLALARKLAGEKGKKENEGQEGPGKEGGCGEAGFEGEAGAGEQPSSGAQSCSGVQPSSGVQPCPLTIGEIVDRWLEEKKGVWKESTYACYFQIVERYIRGIGNREGKEFSDASCRDFLEGIRKKSDGAGISPAYARSIGTVLRQAFRHMSREHGCRLPELGAGRSCRRPQVEVPTDQVMGKLMDHLAAHAGDSTCLGVLLACCTGIRIGELCALKWGDIDLEAGVLRVNRNMQRIRRCGKGEAGTRVAVQTPKTSSSVRSIPLPGFLLRLLKANRREADAYLVAGKKREWAECRTVQYRFAALLKSCGIGHFKFHTLRHYFASRCIRRGFDVKSLSEVMGHSSIQVTLGLYVHSTMEHKRELMEGVFQEAGA